MHAPVGTIEAKVGDNSWASHIRATFSLGIPLIGAQLAQLGIHTTDVVIVGQLGAEKLAAMVLAGQFLFTVFIFGSGISIAVMPMVAQAFGQGDAVAIRRSLRMGLWASIGYWLLALPIYLHAETILVLLQQKPEIAKLAGDYVRIAAFAMLPGLLFLVLRSLVSAVGRAGVILWVTIATLILNAMLAYALVLGHFGFPRLGMMGAAIVSVVVQVFGLIALIAYIQMIETRKYEVFVRFWRPDWHALKEVVMLGLPIGITVLAEVSLFTAASLMVGAIGTLELAAHGISLQLASIAFMIPLGLSQAATVRVGVHHGQGDYHGMVRASLTVLGIASVIAVLGGVLMIYDPVFFASFYVSKDAPETPELLSIAAKLIVVAGIFQLVDGVQAIANGLLRGLKDASVPMVLALIAYWPIGFGLAWLFAFPLGYRELGVWFGFLVGLGAACVFLCVRFYMLVRRERVAFART
jgi:MATE family multidrug resistance protein